MDEHHKKVEIMQGAELHKIAQKENYAASSSQQHSTWASSSFWSSFRTLSLFLTYSETEDLTITPIPSALQQSTRGHGDLKRPLPHTELALCAHCSYWGHHLRPPTHTPGLSCQGHNWRKKKGSAIFWKYCYSVDWDKSEKRQSADFTSDDHHPTSCKAKADTEVS